MNYLDYAASKGCILGNQQRKILCAFESNQNVAVTNGHSVGVSYAMAVALAYHLECEPDTVVMVGGASIESAEMLVKQASAIAEKNLSRKIYLFSNRNHLVGRKVNGKLVVFASDGDEIDKEIGDALTGMLVGPEHKMFVAGNPIYIGHSLLKQAFAPVNPNYERFTLSALDHENVVKTNHVQSVRPIEGNGLNYAWVKDKIDKWCVETKKEDINPDVFSFKGKYYIPNAEFKARVLGQWN